MSIINDIADRTNDLMGRLNGLITPTTQTSALDESYKAVAEANAFNAAQAALNRQFQQASAERSMSVSSSEAALAREFSAAESQKNRDFQERMSNTSYQRAMEDLKAAGLSPLLLYSSLSGASSPSGSTAQAFSGSGSQASGSQASGYVVDPNSARKADLGVLESLIPIMIVDGLSSALKSYVGSSTYQKVNKFFNAVEYEVSHPKPMWKYYEQFDWFNKYFKPVWER